jgi:phosphatidate cytidylyltransferase
MRRVLTAALLVPIIVCVVLWANFWLFLAVLATVAVLCYREFNDVCAAYGFGAPGPLGYGAGLLLLVWEGDAWLIVVLVALLAFSLAVQTENLAGMLPRSALLIAGVLYVFGTWKCALPLREHGPHWLMYSLLLNWTGDIAAYYVGRQFGRHKLAPRVSPNKSWEGAVASVAAAVIIGGAYLWRFLPEVPLSNVIILTAVANAAGQVGDLVESAIKRGAGVKDSGTILPGHGGFLDRVDSTLFTLPVVYAYVKLTT